MHTDVLSDVSYGSVDYTLGVILKHGLGFEDKDVTCQSSAVSRASR